MEAAQNHGRKSLLPLALGALGVVFGDIGTSPLYAMRETFEGPGHELVVSRANVLGVLSLILWSLILIIAVKYVAFVMKADNHGEGGILALTALVGTPEHRGARRALVLLGLFGTALLYGDGMITPAISVLSAVEGTKVAAPSLSGAVIPISLVILVGLFAIQRRGTASIGKLFGPVMVVWFGVLATLGAVHLSKDLSVLEAVNPVHAVRFIGHGGMHAFLALGSVFLVVTGGEALYADMGHFGRRPIAWSWYVVVLPALTLNYFGQGALLLNNPKAIESPFYAMAPSWGVLPLVVLATLATVIASQALISGVFSLTMQAVQLGYVPRVRIHHTSADSHGQIYVPAVNWGLLAACIALVLGFRTSSNLAAAYGVAVTATMVITTALFFMVLRRRFSWPAWRAGALCAAFGVIELGFFTANVFKIPAGGWFPLVVGALVFTVMTSWRTGRRIVAERIRRHETRLSDVLDRARAGGMARVEGTAVYLCPDPGLAPPALVANLTHNRVLHDQVVTLAIRVEEVPRVPAEDRAEVTDLGEGVHQVLLRYGFMEEPNVPLGITEGAAAVLCVHDTPTTYFLGAENLRVTDRPGMAKWREHLFATLSRNATPAATWFGLPPEETFTVAQQVEL